MRFFDSTHSDTPHYSGGTSGLTQGPPSDYTQHSHETDIHKKRRDSNLQPTEIGRLHTPCYFILQCCLHISAHVDPVIREKNTRERMYVIILESFSHSKMCSLSSAFAVPLTACHYGIGIWANTTDDFPYFGRKINLWHFYSHIYEYLRLLNVSNKPIINITLNFNNQYIIYTYTVIQILYSQKTVNIIYVYLTSLHIEFKQTHM